MTVSNMTIEAGARAGLIAPDERPRSTMSRDARWRPKAAHGSRRINFWKTLPSDEGASL